MVEPAPRNRFRAEERLAPRFAARQPRLERAVRTAERPTARAFTASIPSIARSDKSGTASAALPKLQIAARKGERAGARLRSFEAEASGPFARAGNERRHLCALSRPRRGLRALSPRSARASPHRRHARSQKLDRARCRLYQSRRRRRVELRVLPVRVAASMLLVAACSAPPTARSARSQPLSSRPRQWRRRSRPHALGRTARCGRAGGRSACRRRRQESSSSAVQPLPSGTTVPYIGDSMAGALRIESTRS
jgi:hypothetical protein